MVEVELADTGNGAGYKLPVASRPLAALKWFGVVYYASYASSHIAFTLAIVSQ